MKFPFLFRKNDRETDGASELGVASQPMVDLESFVSLAREHVLRLREFLGEEAFAALKVIDTKPPSAGEMILEARGLTPKTIARNLKNLVDKLDAEIGSNMIKVNEKNASFIWQFIRETDDIADIAVMVGSQADEYSHNLMEYQLSLINYLRKYVGEELIQKQLRRFSARETLRSKKLFPYSAMYTSFVAK